MFRAGAFVILALMAIHGAVSHAGPAWVPAPPREYACEILLLTPDMSGAAKTPLASDEVLSFVEHSLNLLPVTEAPTDNSPRAARLTASWGPEFPFAESSSPAQTRARFEGLSQVLRDESVAKQIVFIRGADAIDDFLSKTQRASKKAWIWLEKKKSREIEEDTRNKNDIVEILSFGLSEVIADAIPRSLRPYLDRGTVAKMIALDLAARWLVPPETLIFGQPWYYFSYPLFFGVDQFHKHFQHRWPALINHPLRSLWELREHIRPNWKRVTKIPEPRVGRNNHGMLSADHQFGIRSSQILDQLESKDESAAPLVYWGVDGNLGPMDLVFAYDAKGEPGLLIVSRDPVP